MADDFRRSVLTMAELAAELGCSEAVARRRAGDAVLDGRVTLVRVGRSVLIARSDLDQIRGAVRMNAPRGIALSGGAK